MKKIVAKVFDNEGRLCSESITYEYDETADVELVDEVEAEIECCDCATCEMCDEADCDECVEELDCCEEDETIVPAIGWFVEEISEMMGDFAECLSLEDIDEMCSSVRGYICGLIYAKLFS